MRCSDLDCGIPLTLCSVVWGVGAVRKRAGREHGARADAGGAAADSPGHAKRPSAPQPFGSEMQAVGFDVQLGRRQWAGHLCRRRTVNRHDRGEQQFRPQACQRAYAQQQDRLHGIEVHQEVSAAGRGLRWHGFLYLGVFCGAGPLPYESTIEPQQTPEKCAQPRSASIRTVDAQVRPGILRAFRIRSAH